MSDGQERRRRAVLLEQVRAAGRRAELGVEGVQALVDVRVVVGVDDGDGLAGAVEGEVVDAVGGADLRRGVDGRAVADRLG